MMNANRKKKRVLAGTMAALMVATSSPTGAFTYQDLSIVKAETVATEGYYTEDGFYIEDGVLRWYRGEEENIVIPNDVVSIGSGAFLDDEIKSVTIPESVTRIEEYAFYKTSLEEITIPDTVEYLGEYAFSRCEKLSKAELNTKTIEQNAFANCTKLTQVTFGDNVETIDREAFKNCEKLEILTLGKGIKNIGICCFQSCISLKEVSFPTGIDTIGTIRPFTIPAIGIVRKNPRIRCSFLARLIFNPAAIIRTYIATISLIRQ